MIPYVQPESEIPPWPPTGHIPDPVCRACGWERTSTNEPDGCLGWLPDTHNACCGHGRLYVKNGQITESTELWLSFELADHQGNSAPLIIGPGPWLHEAFDYWRSGDIEKFSALVGYLAVEGLRRRIERRLKMVVEVERAAGIPQRSRAEVSVG